MRAGGPTVVALTLALLAGPTAAAAPAAAPAPGGSLQQVIAGLESEADRLESLAAGARVGGGDGAVALLAQLALVEARVWCWQVAAEAAREGLLGGATPGEADGPGEPYAPISAPGLVAADDAATARLRPLLTDWAAYQRALGRVLRLLDDMRGAAVTGAPGLPAAGRVCPVAGPHWYEPTWAEARGWGRDHKGEDVHAAPGTPLLAIESGTIVQSGWHWAGGIGVYLEGRYSGGVYYYAHLAGTAPGIRPGQEVVAGDLLGWVGSTGNADSPHLHLGWIPHARGGVDLEGLADPFPLLVGLCGPG